MNKILILTIMGTSFIFADITKNYYDFKLQSMKNILLDCINNKNVKTDNEVLKKCGSEYHIYKTQEKIIWKK